MRARKQNVLLRELYQFLSVSKGTARTVNVAGIMSYESQRGQFGMKT